MDAKRTFISQIPESLKEDLIKSLRLFSQEKWIGAWSILGMVSGESTFLVSYSSLSDVWIINKVSAMKILVLIVFMDDYLQSNICCWRKLVYGL